MEAGPRIERDAHGSCYFPWGVGRGVWRVRANLAETIPDNATVGSCVEIHTIPAQQQYGWMVLKASAYLHPAEKKTHGELIIKSSAVCYGCLPFENLSLQFATKLSYVNVNILRKRVFLFTHTYIYIYVYSLLRFLVQMNPIENRLVKRDRYSTTNLVACDLQIHFPTWYHKVWLISRY